MFATPVSSCASERVLSSFSSVPDSGIASITSETEDTIFVISLGNHELQDVLLIVMDKRIRIDFYFVRSEMDLNAIVLLSYDKDSR